MAFLGNPGKRPRKRAVPKAQNDLPRAPAYLTQRATEIFGRLVGRLDAQKLASSSHTEMLGLAAMRLAEVEEYSKILDEAGPSERADHGLPVAEDRERARLRRLG